MIKLKDAHIQSANVKGKLKLDSLIYCNIPFPVTSWWFQNKWPWAKSTLRNPNNMHIRISEQNDKFQLPSLRNNNDVGDIWTFSKQFRKKNNCLEHISFNSLNILCKFVSSVWMSRFLSEMKGRVLNVHWKDWCWSWNSNTLATWCEERTHWKRPWCWERLKAGGKGDNRGWDDWMASPIRWT